MLKDLLTLKGLIYDPQWDGRPLELLSALSTYHFPIPPDPAHPERDRRLDVINKGHEVRRHDKGDPRLHVVYVFVEHSPEESHTRVLYVGETETIGRTLDYLYKKHSSTHDPERDQIYYIIKRFATDLHIVLIEGGRPAARDIEERLTFALKPALYRNFLMATWQDVKRYRITLPQ